ncbi:hypothetical protein LCGC14_2538420 [marine sediment metagenome]|uniref:HNH nuclease domain-containing protein n=1 Tax=marine sediment metagenome TaxID=412755 RepID=A0A0F9BE98_9ZZZZ
MTELKPVPQVYDVWEDALGPCDVILVRDDTVWAESTENLVTPWSVDDFLSGFRFVKRRGGEETSRPVDTPDFDYDEYLHTEHWQAVRVDALRRAGHRCQLCNSPESLDVHHRTYARLWRERPADVVVLCRTCHDVFHDRLALHYDGPDQRQKDE